MIKSLISWLCLSSFSSALMLNNYLLLTKTSALPDAISAALLWLVGGAVVLSSLSLEDKLSVNIMWWSLSVILLASFSALNLLWFYVLFELSLIPILLMILSAGNQPERLSAGAYLLFYTAMASIPYLVFIISMGVTHMKMWDSAAVMVFGALGILIMLPFLIKMPVFGFHFWLPKAHVEADTAGSMLLAGLLLKLGSYGALRISSLFVLGSNMIVYQGLWVILSVMSGVLTMMQSDVKKIIAYSSVTHMTFMIVALVNYNSVSVLCVSLLSLAHAWAAMMMFSVGGILSQITKSRAMFLISPQKSLDYLIILFGLALISNASVPPMPSFFPELMMLSSVILISFTLSATFILLSLSVCYYNAFLFFSLSHMKPWSGLPGKNTILAVSSFSALLSANIISLFWMGYF